MSTKQNSTTEQNIDNTLRNRMRGALVGLACGDALGTTLEFRPRNHEDNKHTEMIGGGFFSVKAGEWTDDTAMALCLAASLTEQGSFEPYDQLKRYVRWYEDGYQACQGVCIDMGGTTSAALRRFIEHDLKFAGSPLPRTSGNGGIMRLAPAVMAAADEQSAVAMAVDSSRTTHASADCLDSAELLGRILWRLLQGESLPKVLNNLPDFKPRSDKILRLLHGYFRILERDDVDSSGYVISTLEAALWSCYHATTFEEALINAVNLGGDADTVGAVTGQIAGAAFGVDAIPARWRYTIAWWRHLEMYSDQLMVCGVRYEAI